MSFMVMSFFTGTFLKSVVSACLSTLKCPGLLNSGAWNTAQLSFAFLGGADLSTGAVMGDFLGQIWELSTNSKSLESRASLNDIQHCFLRSSWGPGVLAQVCTWEGQGLVSLSPWGLRSAPELTPSALSEVGTIVPSMFFPLGSLVC